MKQRTILNKRKIILGLLFIVAIVGIYSIVVRLNNNNESSEVSYSPPTEEEKQQAADNKERLVAELEKDSNNTGEDVTASEKPVIASITNTEVRGFMPGVAEENGNCTATAQNSDATSSGSSKGFINVSYTQCAPIVWDKPLTEGSWTVTLKYESATITGSTTQTMEVGQ